MNPTTARRILGIAALAVIGAPGAVSRENQTRTDLLEWAAKQAVEHERRRVAFVAEHGGLIWRAMPWFGLNNFVTEMLEWYQVRGEITPKQLDALRRTVGFLEHGLRGRTQ